MNFRNRVWRHDLHFRIFEGVPLSSQVSVLSTVWNARTVTTVPSACAETSTRQATCSNPLSISAGWRRSTTRLWTKSSGR